MGSPFSMEGMWEPFSMGGIWKGFTFYASFILVSPISLFLG